MPNLKRKYKISNQKRNNTIEEGFASAQGWIIGGGRNENRDYFPFIDVLRLDLFLATE
jgi:hypothetical protein